MSTTDERIVPADMEGGRYAVVASLERGDVPVKSFGSMTEAILYTFEVEALVITAGFECPAMRVEHVRQEAP
jgi:hypothetical protein